MSCVRARRHAADRHPDLAPHGTSLEKVAHETARHHRDRIDKGPLSNPRATLSISPGDVINSSLSTTSGGVPGVAVWTGPVLDCQNGISTNGAQTRLQKW